MTAVRIAISAERCTGHGRCYGMAASGWLQPDDEGYVSLRGQELEVPEGKENEALAAEAMCPEMAIEAG